MSLPLAPMPISPTVLEAAQALAEGRTSSRALVEDALARIGEPGGEGARAFMTVHAEEARRLADEVDHLRRRGQAPSPLAGIPISVKDLFDEIGQTSRAGSTVLADAPPAIKDACAIARLKQAGMISVGRTTMTEFAFSGVGLNPHYGTPANPWRREDRRIPGGSSSGAAISVTDGMAVVGIGSDTGGSCRIPAALTGLVGYKPTASRISTEGTIPLSFTLDSVGSLGRSVACCRAADVVMATGAFRVQDVRPHAVEGLRLGVLQSYVMDSVDNTVGRAWEACLKRLSDKGVVVQDFSCPVLDELPTINSKGGFPAPESLAWHRPFLDAHEARYDPFVLRRILRGREQSAVDYIDLLTARRRVQRQAADVMDHFDAVILPTVPIVAPRITEMTDDAHYAAINLLLLRNTTVANILDRCAISLPCHRPGDAPVGLMVMGRHGEDDALFDVAAHLESLLRV